MSNALLADLWVNVAFLAQGDRAREKSAFLFLSVVVEPLATLVTTVDTRNRTVFTEVFLANGVLASVELSIESVTFYASITALRPRDATIITVVDSRACRILAGAEHFVELESIDALIASEQAKITSRAIFAVPDSTYRILTHVGLGAKKVSYVALIAPIYARVFTRGTVLDLAV